MTPRPGCPRHLRALFESLGCTVIAQEPAAHDLAMAKTHALAFFIAKALVETGVGEGLSLAPPSFPGLVNMLAAVRGAAPPPARRRHAQSGAPWRWC